MLKQIASIHKKDIWLFARGWLRSPFKVGAVLPSSMALARAMAGQVDTHSGDPVIELGGGTGAVTRALLDHGVDPKQLFVVERDPGFCRRLQDRFPHVQLLNIDATGIADALRARGIERAGHVVSSLPLLSLDRRTGEAILRSSFDILGGEGAFIQYTYGAGSPIRPHLLKELDITGCTADRIWMNVPPATVWRYSALLRAGDCAPERSLYRAYSER
jgi:phosphatidylethanolamine/phosphatidyl-N-methylethanolamine N-methyltransferase